MPDPDDLNLDLKNLAELNLKISDKMTKRLLFSGFAEKIGEKVLLLAKLGDEMKYKCSYNGLTDGNVDLALNNEIFAEDVALLKINVIESTLDEYSDMKQQLVE